METFTLSKEKRVKDIEGNIYAVVKIGNQEWTVENLKTTKYNDGTSITHRTAWGSGAVGAVGAYCYYNNDAGNKAKYGALYNFHAVNTGKLAPEGWHVPTDAEWTELEEYLIANGYNWDGTTIGNKIAKSLASKSGWNSLSDEGDIGDDMKSNNRTGFSALPGGYRSYRGNFYGMGNNGDWWSATGYNTSYAYNCYLCYNDESLVSRGNYKECYLSVRLVRDNK